jgi:aminobenzoyl-glutamate utilization protein A
MQDSVANCAWQCCKGLDDKIIEWRRDFHRYPELRWTEFRTAALIARHLNQLGYKVIMGKQAQDPASRRAMLGSEETQAAKARALALGADHSLVDAMTDGLTGVIGILSFGTIDGSKPVVALRFDMDAIAQHEPREDRHRPYKMGFASQNEGIMHACGHDGHVAIGLGVAEALAVMVKQNVETGNAEMCGTVKLIFQPAEEGAHGGGQSIVNVGHVDDVDYFIACHIGMGATSTGQISTGTKDFLATTKMDAVFKGISSHAGGKPELGKNALLAASSAVLNLHALSRHSEGATRVNVGVIQGGSARNIICDNVKLELETRGADSRLNDFLQGRAELVLAGAASMHDVVMELSIVGECPGATSDPELSKKIAEACRKLWPNNDIREIMSFGAGDDATFYMQRVHENGGKATYMLFGADLADSHHGRYFDFDERVLPIAARTLVTVTADLLRGA